MAIEVKVPSVGESITSGTIGTWHKKNGDYVKAQEVLFEIETEKVTSEVHAEVGGVLKILAETGATVDVGQVVASIDEKAPAPAAAAPAAAPAPAPKAEEKKAAAPAPAAAAPAPARDSGAAALSPAVRYNAEEKGIDASKLAGTGPGGRVTKGDVLAAPAGGAPSAPAAAGPRSTRKPMSQIRQKIAARLVSAQQEAALLTTFNEVDMTNVMATRAKFQDRFVAKNEIKLGFMSFFVKAVVYALQSVPSINARIEGNEIVQNHYYDIGVAISTEKGLMVPVLRDADALGYAGVEKAIADYAKKGRAGKIGFADLEGGVFTITNGGTFGSLLSTPIVNAPQSGILGMHSIQDRPMAINGAVVIRPMMYIALTYDHRVVDGKEAVTFLVRVKEYIENPGLGLLDL
ncbi:2-oxoglutarate dehydrogenase E2 component [Verrucomicrobium sp. GAS474]|uniref:2-oxoglutarate dehydrogenase complex dihydrolipoyllysine-residue succinyltransferase n=1 Tax=Verrucomicrobium sp. GAS474 TaxID=1882831 RepID=UPI00087B9728|nr:2-oxoglutarate dehydrogenase complex dihydrolipoyllysine-residue succinyltransferase [Verrucomicrobium sp. GAS474]SDU03854.1 2-oxoglutarate dehydrogenase E2 component [Verrucomicrobium sp. GAS474]